MSMWMKKRRIMEKTYVINIVDELFSARRWVIVNGNVWLLKKLSHKSEHIRTMHQVGKLNIKDVSFNKKEKWIKRRTCSDVILFVINLLKKFVLNTCLRLLQMHLFFPLPLKLYECVFLCFYVCSFIFVFVLFFELRFP